MDGSQIRAAVKEFNALRRREDADCEKVTVRRVDEATAIVKLEYEDEGTFASLLALRTHWVLLFFPTFLLLQTA